MFRFGRKLCDRSWSFTNDRSTEMYPSMVQAVTVHVYVYMTGLQYISTFPVPMVAPWLAIFQKPKLPSDQSYDFAPTCLVLA